jgi:hypothetical protein
MQSGFPTRCNFEDLQQRHGKNRIIIKSDADFFNRYARFMPKAIAELKPATFCEALLVALDLHGGRDFQMGLTKV